MLINIVEAREVFETTKKEPEYAVIKKDELKIFLDKIHLTMTELMPGLRHLAYNHIKELNEVLIELDQARHKINGT